MEAPRRHDDSIVVSAALNVLVGIWIAFSPTVLGYGEGDPRVNELICGGLVAALSVR